MPPGFSKIIRGPPGSRVSDFDQPRPATGHRTRSPPRKLKEKRGYAAPGIWHGGCTRNALCRSGTTPASPFASFARVRPSRSWYWLRWAFSIGANTAIYSVLDAVLLRPAPYPGLDRLALVHTHWRQNGKEGEQEDQTGALFEGVPDGSRALDVAAFGGDSGVKLRGPGTSRIRPQQRVSAGFFRVLGIAPRLDGSSAAPRIPPAAPRSRF